jgi:putative oxidoreductase
MLGFLRNPRFEIMAVAALRFVAGAMFTFHGVQKITGWLATLAQPAVGSQMWIGGLIEMIGGALIAFGLFTRPAAFLASGTMAVAYVQFHWKLEMADFKWLPIVNKGELALLYCFVFLLFAIKGAPAFSIDAARGRS